MTQSKFSLVSLTAAFLMMCMLSSEIMIAQRLPSFQIQLTNGKNFSSKNLSRTKPMILIYFAPDCGHCLVLTDAVFKRINEFKNAQILMISFKPSNEIAAFEKQYKTNRYNNIKVGTEIPLYFFRNFYQLVNTPFTALYDRKGNLVISYRKDTPVDDLIKHLRQTR